jgi:RNA polymerase-interacting CarD/CdnL/TRCF family regulator
MDFQVGDQVVHSSYGPGEIVQMDEKVLSGHKHKYYVVQIKDLTLYVPADEETNTSLRTPTPASQFKSLFAIMSGAGDALSENRLERKAQLTEIMRDGTLVSICRVIRDLTYYSRTKKLSETDAALLERARNFLLTEWQVSLDVPYSKAEQDLRQLLADSHPKSK